MNEHGMHIVIIYFLSHDMSQQCNKNCKKPQNTGISFRLSAHQASNENKTGKMWEFHHQTGGDRTGLPAHSLRHKLIHKKKQKNHRKQNMLYLADMSSRLTCSNYFLNLTVVSFLNIKFKKGLAKNL